jgi:hypothetical protein
MSQVETGITTVITGKTDCSILAAILANSDYDTLDADQQAVIPRQHFENFVNNALADFINSGMLDEELNLTGVVKIPLNS